MAKKKAKAKAKAKAVKSKVKKAPARRLKAPPKAAAKKVARASGPRRSWLSDKGHTPLIEEYARQLGTFMEAMADGVIDESEVRDQEARVARLMHDVEPQLDNALHEKVTRLLCELTAYDIMQVLHAMHSRRPQMQFRG